MASVEEEERERGVFDDVEVDESDSDSDSDSEAEDAAAAAAVSAVVTDEEAPVESIQPSPISIEPVMVPIFTSDQQQQQQDQQQQQQQLLLDNNHLLQQQQQRITVEERQRAFEESRKLFQRLWTDEDELIILQSFFEFVSGRGTVHASHQHDTGPFYEQIKAKLQLDFTKNQLIEKLRRLKKKFRNVVSRMASSGSAFAFRSSHEKATFEIARKIWSSHLKRGRDFEDDDDLVNLPIDTASGNAESLSGSDLRRSRRRARKRFASTEAVSASAPPRIDFPVQNSSPVMTSMPAKSAAAVSDHVNSMFSSPPAPVQLVTQNSSPNIVEETVRNCLSPLFKELLESALNSPYRPAIGDGGLGVMPFGLWNNGQKEKGGILEDEKWRKQQILELEVYSKRIELVQEHIKQTLEELRAKGS